MRNYDEAIEERILMEIVVDAYDSVERAMGWYYYLEEKITFSFTATCVSVDKRTPLELGEEIEVMEMSGETYCRKDMLVDILWNGKTLTVPLSQIKPLNADDESNEAIDDWHYWVSRGYKF